MVSPGNESSLNARMSTRRDILESFNVFLVMPHHGQERIPISDVSETGIAFVAVTGMHLSDDSILDTYFYLNLNVRIPLKLKLIYRKNECGIEKIGCEIIDKKTKAYEAFINFIALLNSLSYFVDI